MSEECRHDGGRYVDRYMVTRCVLCLATLPLGPASDDDERVRVEMRAAELAAIARDINDDPDDFMFVGEFNGWEIYRLDKNGGIWPEQYAGYLAAAIAAHDDTAEGGE